MRSKTVPGRYGSSRLRGWCLAASAFWVAEENDGEDHDYGGGGDGEDPGNWGERLIGEARGDSGDNGEDHYRNSKDLGANEPGPSDSSAAPREGGGIEIGRGNGCPVWKREVFAARCDYFVSGWGFKKLSH